MILDSNDDDRYSSKIKDMQKKKYSLSHLVCSQSLMYVFKIHCRMLIM